MEPSTFHSRDDASDRATVEAQLDEWATYSHRQYGAQLRAWVGLQVDEHVSRIVPGLLDARLMPMSETMVELQRQVAVHSSAMDQLQEKLDNELHRTELKLGTARLEAHGELAERTRKSIAALEAQEVEARRDLERRLEDLEAATKMMTGYSLPCCASVGTSRLIVAERFIVGVSMFSNWSTRSAARNQSLERSKQLPALRPPPSMHFADVHLLDLSSNPPGGTFSDPVISRADSFASTRASTGTSLSHGKSIALRENQRKMMVMNFLDANGFMHINEAKTSWFCTSYPLHVAVRQKKAAVVRALLLLGAWRDAKSRRGETPEELAVRCQRRWGGYEDIVKVFEEDKLRSQQSVPVASSFSTSSAPAVSSSASG